ncbi:ABC transporter permease [Cryptosporangium sp. NPDC048952]|uniref:ABC transporter permease n=1 Tax=Cryptosporangium sp. NPDC048952 TaxID=3363961 RepID=UPI00371A9CC6
MPAFAALVRAGFRRHATYRRATFASAFTNSIFGFLKTYVLLAVAANGAAAGYDAAALAMFAWAGQGLIGVVQVFQWTELADRIRTGEIVTDLLRPVDPLLSFLAVDIGRALHALAVRLTVPMAVGALFFPLRWPEHATTWLAVAISVVLATVTSFATRYLINLLAFWWLDARGPGSLWLVGGTLFTGLAVPIPFFPEWAQAVLWCTPFPWMLQAPLDVLLERGSAGALVGGGAVAAGLTLTAAALAQRVAVRRLVVQGG